MDSILPPAEEVLVEAVQVEEEEVEVEPQDLESQLQRFRDQWQRELRAQVPAVSALQRKQELNDDKMRMDEATALFRVGMKMEQEGNMNEAIRFYRRATQLVPDIEFKIDFSNQSPRDRQDSESSVDGGMAGETGEDLLVGLAELSLNEMGSFCEPEQPQRMTHISALPVEVLLYIFKWVVTEELDLRALEVLGQVCRGFYLCSRDEEVWKQACKVLWGDKVGSTKKFGSWRMMYIERPHILCHGCYISRAQYIRHGERSLDGFYAPYHLVQYFRYVRFFSDGQLLMLCTPEEPATVLPKLRTRHNRFSSLMYGHYRVVSNKVTAVLRRVKTGEMITTRYRRRQAANQNESEQLFYLSLSLGNQNRRNHTVLEWEGYSLRSFPRDGEETITNFELNKKTYPPLYFSRVKSYALSCDTPLGGLPEKG